MNKRSALITIPNILTSIRILLIPVLFLLIKNDQQEAAFYLLIGMGFTDLLDGFIARTFNQMSKLGSYLDPIADKLLTTSLFITLTLYNHIPLWLTIIVIGRDVIIAVGLFVIFLPQKFPAVSPSYLGKFTTFAQAITLIISISSGIRYFNSVLSSFFMPSVYITALFTIVSMIQYIHRGIVMLKDRRMADKS